MWQLTIKLAGANIRKNRVLYVPYALAGVVAVTMQYLFWSLAQNDMWTDERGGAAIVSVMNLGVFVVGVASFILIAYANSVVMKQRTRDLAIYNILGLERRHLQWMMFAETACLFAIITTLGIVSGIVLDKLSVAVFNAITDNQHAMASSFQWGIVWQVLLLFAVFFGIIYIANAIKVMRVKPIDLLRERQRGEKKMRFVALHVLMGLAALGWAYYVAQTVESPVKAITLFFFAVLAVIYATYLLFTAGTFVLLRWLKKRKTFYYRPQNFISVSNLIFRMRKNAVGLATICILSTMAIISLSTGFSMYFSVNTQIDLRFAQENQIEVSVREPGAILQDIPQWIQQEVATQGVDSAALQWARYDVFGATVVGQQVQWAQEDQTQGAEGFKLPEAAVTIVDAATYQQLTGQTVSLASDELLLYESQPQLTQDTMQLSDQTYRIQGRLSRGLQGHINSSVNGYIPNYKVLVVADLSQFEQQQAVAPHAVNAYYWFVGWGGDAMTQGEADRIADALREAYAASDYESGYAVSVENRSLFRSDLLNMHGAVMYLMTLLAVMFVLGTVLVIYYKQISEGYEDRDRFVIMQKVGLSAHVAKKAIRQQVSILFLLPLVTALCHTLAALKMIQKILSVMAGTSSTTVLWIFVGVAAVFCVSYLVVYVITSQQYRAIVSRRTR